MTTEDDAAYDGHVEDALRELGAPQDADLHVEDDGTGSPMYTYTTVKMRARAYAARPACTAPRVPTRRLLPAGRPRARRARATSRAGPSDGDPDPGEPASHSALAVAA